MSFREPGDAGAASRKTPIEQSPAQPASTRPQGRWQHSKAAVVAVYPEAYIRRDDGIVRTYTVYSGAQRTPLGDGQTVPAAWQEAERRVLRAG